MVRSDKTLEIQGLLTPRVEMIATKTITELTPGQVLTIIIRDVAAREKLLSLCRFLGCVMIDKKEEGGTIHVQIRR
jgi:TusA-related sulfurtransferase